jgi:spore coat protein U-like protein
MPTVAFSETTKLPAQLGNLTIAGGAGRSLTRPAPRQRGTLALKAACLLAGLAANLCVQAATAPSNIAVSATVQATCTNTATPLAFGVYSGVQSDSTAIITVTCTNTTPYTVALNAGTATGATVTTRRMTGAATVFLAYALFSDAGRTANWGSTVGSDTVAGTGTGVGQPLTVYGRVAAAQFPAPGAYTDTIVATVTY